MADPHDPPSASSGGAKASDDAERLAQQFLRASREHALITTDADGFVSGWFAGAERLLGYTEAEMLGRSLDMLFTPDDRNRDAPWQERAVARAGALSEDDRWHVRRDGTAVWVTGAIDAVRGGNGEVVGYVKLMRDRTDLRAQLDALGNRVDIAEAAAQERSRVLDALGHEMRTPLSALGTAAAVLNAQPPADVATQALKVIGRQIHVLQRLADDLLEAARQRHGKLELRLQRVDLPLLVRDKLIAMQAGYDAKGVRLIGVLPRQPLMLEADTVRVQQILANLLDNALKYTPAGGKVWVKLTVETPHAVLRVEDDGVGIEPEMLPRIFELFTQEQRSAMLAQGGLGIGLALVKSYTELHGGLVEVRSPGEGKGSEFCVRLPLAMPPREGP